MSKKQKGDIFSAIAAIEIGYEILNEVTKDMSPEEKRKFFEEDRKQIE